MKAAQPTDLGRGLVRFFQDHLPTQRGLSMHTVRSYRDALLLFLQFAAHDIHRGVEHLQISDMESECVKRFLIFLEIKRHSSIATRNARLAAIHTFARFLATERSEWLGRLAARKDADLDRNASDFRIHSEAQTSPHRMEFCIQASDAVATDYK
jgi:site-specific recombinase XerD